MFIVINSCVPSVKHRTISLSIIYNHSHLFKVPFKEQKTSEDFLIVIEKKEANTQIPNST